METVKGDARLREMPLHPGNKGLRHVATNFGDLFGITAMRLEILAEALERRGVLALRREQHPARRHVHKHADVLVPALASRLVK